jgi:N-methylhydantoinase B
MCLAKLLDASQEHHEYARAASGGGVGIVDMAGRDQHGRPFFMPILDGCFGSGMGARSGHDGIHSSGPTSAIDSLIANVETMEEQYPVLYLARRHVCDGSGSGEYLGGTSIAPFWVPHGVEQIDDVITHGFGIAPESFGLSGGYPGAHFQTAIMRDSDILDQFERGRLPTELSEVEGALEVTGSMHRAVLSNRDVYWSIATSPGGGYGDPLLRDPERVLADLAECIVSEEGARRMYGVELRSDEAGVQQVDVAATARRRAEIRETRRTESQPPIEIFDAAATIPSDLGNEQRMMDSLSVVDFGGECLVRCACGHVLGPAAFSYKALSRCRESSVHRAGLKADLFELASEFVFREFFCPGCLIVLATEVARRGDPFVPDIGLSYSARELSGDLRFDHSSN